MYFKEAVKIFEKMVGRFSGDIVVKLRHNNMIRDHN